jgi:hypothetical protein
MCSRMCSAFVVMMLLVACGGGRTADMPASTATAKPADTPVPVATARQVVQNGSFDSDTGHWDRPYGTLRRTTSEYNTEPGAAQLITSDSSDHLDYRGTFGQCINLRSTLGDWPESGDQKQMTLEAYLKTDASIADVSLNGIFLESTRCDKAQVGYINPPSVAGNQDWTRVSATAAIPDTANSMHVFVWATGVNDSATVYVDDIRAYSSDPDAAQ